MLLLNDDYYFKMSNGFSNNTYTKSEIDEKFATKEEVENLKNYSSTFGIEIPEGSDANDYTEVGVYGAYGNVTETMLNLPFSGVNCDIRIEVKTIGTGIMQTLYTNQADIYHRRFYDTSTKTWGEWYIFSGTKEVS